MQDHKLIQVLQKFDSETCKRFLVFLASPYFNKIERINKLGKYLLEFHPQFDQPALTAAQTYAVLFGDKPFNQHELTRYLSKLFVLVEEFIVVESLDDFTFLKSTLRANHYYKTHNGVRFHKAHRAAHRLLLNAQPTESASYFYLYLNQKQAHSFLMQEARPKDAQSLFYAATGALNHYFFVEVLQAATTLRYQHRATDIETALPLLNATLAHIAQHLDTLPPLVVLWYHTYRLTTEPADPDMYDILKQALESHLGALPAIDARNFTVILKTTLKSQTHLNQKARMEILFFLYKIEIEAGWVVADQIINYRTFTNIIATSVNLGEAAFAQHFFENYHAYLIPEVHEAMYSYNLARIAFGQGDFTKSLSLAQQTPYLDVPLTLNVKRLQMMCMYAVEDEDALEMAINAFAVYVHRISDDHLQTARSLNQYFLMCIKRLCKDMSKSLSPESRHVIQDLLDTHPLLPEGIWLAQHIR